MVTIIYPSNVLVIDHRHASGKIDYDLSKPEYAYKMLFFLLISSKYELVERITLMSSFDTSLVKIISYFL